MQAVYSQVELMLIFCTGLRAGWSLGIQKSKNPENEQRLIKLKSLRRWEALTPEQRRKFPPIAPDFVIELRSATDDLETLQEKMEEYLDAGVRLGWLFNPQQQQVEIYRQGQQVEVQNLPVQLSGEAVLPGFTLNVALY